MARPKLRGVLLCEDREHERFFRRLLEKKWFGRGKVQVNRIPNRQGAGDAWVLKNYVKEIRYARIRRAENYALVVVIDGDHFGLRERLRRFDHVLKEAGFAARGLAEKVVICVPTRNIETWELWLCGDQEIDESSDYKQSFREAERRGEVSVKDAVEAWFRDLPPEEGERERTKVPSLAAGRWPLGSPADRVVERASPIPETADFPFCLKERNWKRDSCRPAPRRETLGLPEGILLRHWKRLSAFDHL